MNYKTTTEILEELYKHQFDKLFEEIDIMKEKKDKLNKAMAETKSIMKEFIAKPEAMQAEAEENPDVDFEETEEDSPSYKLIPNPDSGCYTKEEVEKILLEEPIKIRGKKPIQPPMPQKPSTKSPSLAAVIQSLSLADKQQLNQLKSSLKQNVRPQPREARGLLYAAKGYSHSVENAFQIGSSSGPVVSDDSVNQYIELFHKDLKGFKKISGQLIYELGANYEKSIPNEDTMNIKALITAQNYLIADMHKKDTNVLEQLSREYVHTKKQNDQYSCLINSREQCVVIKESAKASGYICDDFNTAAYDYFNDLLSKVDHYACIDIKKKKLFWELIPKTLTLKKPIQKGFSLSSSSYYTVGISNFMEIFGLQLENVREIVRKAKRNTDNQEIVVINGIDCPKELIEEIIEMKIEDLLTAVTIQTDIDNYEGEKSLLQEKSHTSK